MHKNVNGIHACVSCGGADAHLASCTAPHIDARLQLRPRETTDCTQEFIDSIIGTPNYHVLPYESPRK